MRNMGSLAALQERDYLLQQKGIQKWVCIFPRKRTLNPQKNWPEENWTKLMELIREKFGYGIILMGREEDTSLITKENDWFISTASIQTERALDLNLAFLEKSIASIGSESGGPFLSMLCGSPTFIMGGPDYEKRYKKDENFLGTECCFIPKRRYKHPYDEIANKVLDFLNALSEKEIQNSQNNIYKHDIFLDDIDKKNIDAQPYQAAAKRSYLEQYKFMEDKFGYKYEKRDPKINNLKVFGQHQAEFEDLDQFLQAYRNKHPFACFVELGVHTGASTWMLSRHLEESALVIGVDARIFKGGEYSDQVYEQLRREGFTCHSLVKQTHEAFEDVKKIVKSKGIDLLHLDANENYMDLRKDWDEYASLVNLGGIILLHDIEYVEDIQRFWGEIKIKHECREICCGGQGMGIISRK